MIIKFYWNGGAKKWKLHWMNWEKVVSYAKNRRESRL